MEKTIKIRAVPYEADAAEVLEEMLFKLWTTSSFAFCCAAVSLFLFSAKDKITLEKRQMEVYQLWSLL